MHGLDAQRSFQEELLRFHGWDMMTKLVTAVTAVIASKALIKVQVSPTTVCWPTCLISLAHHGWHELVGLACIRLMRLTQPEPLAPEGHGLWAGEDQRCTIVWILSAMSSRPAW